MKDYWIKVELICKNVNVPVIAKEVGWGFSAKDVKNLVNAGVSAIDVAGSGGTSWSEVEYHRAPTAFHARVARAFANWGIPTSDAVRFMLMKQRRIHLLSPVEGYVMALMSQNVLHSGHFVGGMAGPF